MKTPKRRSNSLFYFHCEPRASFCFPILNNPRPFLSAPICSMFPESSRYIQVKFDANAKGALMNMPRKVRHSGKGQICIEQLHRDVEYQTMELLRSLDSLEKAIIQHRYRHDTPWREYFLYTGLLDRGEFLHIDKLLYPEEHNILPPVEHDPRHATNLITNEQLQHLLQQAYRDGYLAGLGRR